MYEVLTSLCKTNIRNKNDVMENIELKIPYTYEYIDYHDKLLLYNLL